MNEWDHWAVLTSIRAKSKHIIWRPGHSQKRPEPGAAYIRNGTSPPQKIPLPPHSAFPQFILVKASRGPWQVSHPLWLTSHSFIHSFTHSAKLNSHLLYVNHCARPWRGREARQPACQPCWGQGGTCPSPPLSPARSTPGQLFRDPWLLHFFFFFIPKASRAAAQKISVFSLALQDFFF